MERLLGDAHALAARWWDPARRLLVVPDGAADGDVAATACWVHGLLARGRPGDREVAETAVGGVLERRLDDRAATALAVVVRDHVLPARLDDEVRAAVGTHLRDAPDVDLLHTSAAVQRAWLELEVGRWTSDEALLAAGAERARAVAADAGVRGHVAEHVGPATTGLTLLGLSLWAERPPVEDLAPLGTALRDEVWHDLLAVWHPGLRTLVPPFTTASGMDLRSHVTATGIWVAWLVDGPDPLPPLHAPTLPGAQDLPLVFLVDALAGASEDVRDLAPLVRVQPARQGEWYDRVGERVWTGWTGGDLAVGAEWSPDDRANSQGVPAAAVWRGDDGRTVWLRLQQQDGPVEARVEHEDGVVRLVHGTRAGAVQLWCGGSEPTTVTTDRLVLGGRTWHLAGVADVRSVACDTPDVEVSRELVPNGDGIVLHTDV